MKSEDLAVLDSVPFLFWATLAKRPARCSAKSRGGRS